ncbi:MAG: gamma-glutamylcyclotransferase [Planctomycetia bacterium]|nr:gamma-glutamylcyclotransferase [Planctomycetia bacterium]
MDAWYFAYGSNLLTDQMLARVGSIGRAEHPPRVARLAHYRLVFQHLKPGEPAYANILALGPSDSTSSVLGVVYRSSEAELAKLDVYEQGYERRPIEVTDLAGQTLAAVAYIVRPTDALNIGRPSDEYLLRITTGARRHGLPEAYIDEIIALAASGTSREPRPPTSRRA